jgi:hypothetical protein
VQSDHRGNFIRRPSAQAATINARYPTNRIAVTVAYALMSGIILLWLAYLSSVTRSILSGLTIVPDDHAAFSSTINRSNKGDRLSFATFDDRWSALGEREVLRPTVTNPPLCQSDARCGAKVVLITRLALGE